MRLHVPHTRPFGGRRSGPTGPGRTASGPARRSRARTRLSTFAVAVLAVAGQAAVIVPPVAAATTNTLTLHVQSARAEPRAFGGAGVEEGAPIGAYTFIINEDNTGTTTQRTPADGCSPASAGYPDSCNWASIAGLAGSAPIAVYNGSNPGEFGFAQGDQTLLNGTTGLNLPDGRYLISVLADGYKIDGAHFTVPLTTPGLVTVEMQPTPLPTATIRAQIFADTTEANGQLDPGEVGLPGFAGQLADYLGQVTTDVFGNQLCTEYETDGNGQVILTAPDYEPTAVPGTGGVCYSDADGLLTIPNMGTNRYALSVLPPAGSDWIQTTTLEGNHDWDAWVMEGATGFDTEFVVAGEPIPTPIFGYVPGPSSTYWDDPDHSFTPGGTGTIKGVVDAMDIYVPQTGGLSLPTIGVLGRQDRPPDRQAVDHALRPWPRRHRRVRRAGQCRRHLPDQQRAGRHLHAHVLGRAPELHPRPHPGHGRTTARSSTWASCRWPAGGPASTATSSTTRTATACVTRASPASRTITLTMRKRENYLMDRGGTTVTTDQSGYYSIVNGVPDDAVAGDRGLRRPATTRRASPTRPTTSPSRPPSRAPASTSACCRSSASLAGRLGRPRL